MCDQSVAEVPVPVADEFLHGVPLHNSVPSLATTENLSVTFFSCQSISSPVHKIDTDAVKRTENALGIEINDARSYSPVHIDKDALDLGDFGALDDEDAFVGSTRFKESRMASVAEAGSAVPSMSSSCSSLAEDIPIVHVSESMASAVSTAHCAPGCMNVTGSGNLRGVDYSEVDDIDGDVPLADILEFSQATIVSPLVLVEVDKASTKKAGAQVNKENKHAQSLEVSDKTRWYSSALAKAAQLDGFRHLNFRIKVSANQKPRLKGNSAVNKGDARLERIRRRGNSNSNSINDNDSLVTASPAVAPIDAQEKVFRQQRKKTFRFNEAVAVYETWDRDAYDRKGMPLSRLDAEQLEVIKEELNAFKMNEMYVHEDSRANTHIIC
ncbi:bud neck involved protein [Coemansia sp. RSA 1933]|nr:bud neck involved protein [Coemansia sp. RSA 1933]